MNMEKISGHINHITYRSEDDNFTVARLELEGSGRKVTIVGNLPAAWPGIKLDLTGRWEVHPRYGERFYVEEAKDLYPTSIEGMERYLSSGWIKGIGPVMAKRLVERFGIETFKIIETEIERLSEVEGLGPKRIAQIKEAWEEHRELRETLSFLQGLGLGPGMALRVYRHYGKDTRILIKNDPYRVSREVWGIGFKKADQIAKFFDFKPDSRERILAGIYHILREKAEEGNSYLPINKLLPEVSSLLELPESLIRKVLYDNLPNDIVRDSIEGKEVIYLRYLHLSETGSAYLLNRLLTNPSKKIFKDYLPGFVDILEKIDIALGKEQEEAIKLALNNRISVITGGPGTGKTTLVKAILQICRKNNLKVALCAPTGRAAKRLAEATGENATTIHRLLEYNPGKEGFGRTQKRPLNFNVIIVDEVSMLDISLFYHLLSAIRSESMLVLVGDVDQLPSVGPGNVLKDLIESNTIPVAYLRHIYRQKEESLIILNAHRINSGHFPYLKGKEKKERDFYFLEEEEPEKVLNTIIELVTVRLPGHFNIDPWNDIQVISPMHRGIVGTENLNTSLQIALNKNSKSIKKGKKEFRLGDKVMQVKNNYEKDIFNGDIGRIIDLAPEKDSLTVSFYGKEVSYEISELDEIIHAYAISVHKSQGSEFPCVIMPILTQHYLLLKRNLLYTAITRAKNLMILVGTKRALAIAIRNDQAQNRYSGLQYRLRSLYKPIS